MKHRNQSNTHPNIVYVLADDLGIGDISCLNARSRIHTRHIDQLADEGMKFRDAHASSAVCTPSRYSILTGRYNWRSIRKEGVGYGYTPHLIEDGRMTAASFLKTEGYRTACIGKWHLGLDWARTDGGYPADEHDVDFNRPIQNGPNSFGFDEFFGISASLDMPPYAYINNNRVTAVPDHISENNNDKRFWRAGPTAPDFFHIDVLPTLTRKAVDFVRAGRENEKPFFLYFPLPAPHTPILPTADYLGKSRANIYGDFVLQCDATVGALMNAVAEIDQTDCTIFIFTSDNGCSPRAGFAELALTGHYPSYIHRGHKADIYDGGHRIPLVVRWPDRIETNTESDQTVCLCDLLATCADITDTSLPEDAGEDSVSNLPVWTGSIRGDSNLREATVHHSVDGSFSIRKGRWKLELCPGSGGWSYPRPGEEPNDAPPMQLYDMHADPGERKNQFDARRDVVVDLIRLLSRYVKEGRSTPGAPQPNTGPMYWPQLHWLSEAEMQRDASRSCHADEVRDT